MDENKSTGGHGEHHSSSHHSSHHSSRHSSHHSSHHGSKRSKSRKKSGNNNKKIEVSKNALTVWVALLTLVVTLLGIWNISMSVHINHAVWRMEELVQKGGVSADNATQIDTDKSKVPDYVDAEADRVIEQVKSLQNENTISFFAISDMHLDNTDTASVNALEHAGMAMRIMREELKIDFAANLGDMTLGTETTTVEKGENEIKMAKEITDMGFAGIPSFALVGNHDLLLTSYAQNNDYLDSKELYKLIGKQNEGAIFQQGEEDRGYCYRDLEDSKLRVICLNTNDIKNVTDPNVLTDESKYCTISPEQTAWLAKTLDLSAKADAGEWKILLLSHIPLYTTGYEHVSALLDGYNAGRAGTVNAGGTSVNFDFTGKNAAKIISNIHGHLHNYRTDVIGASKIPAICVPNACYSRNNTKMESESEEYRNRYGEKVTYNKTYNTAQDTAFYVITVDFEYNRIYATRYGAGVDREISF